MGSAVRLSTKVLPGSRVEFTAPELLEGQEVEVIVMLPDRPRPGGGVADFLAALPPVPRTPEEWAAAERELREERESWDR